MTAAFGFRKGHGPLSGVTVLDLSGYVAGPYGCTLLGDLGAVVIKIEPPEGDNLRNYPSTLAQESRAFLGVNRNKHGIGLDLKNPAGLGVLRRMVEAADVLVHNFRPRSRRGSASTTTG
jgi:formyl-CoA transferase